MPTTNFVILPSNDDAGLVQTATAVKNLDGVANVFYGPKIEDPSKSVIVAVWPKTPKPEQIAEAVGTKKADVRTLELENTSVLEAPATEIVTAYGIGDGFLKNVKDFGVKMDAAGLKGYHGGAHGKVEEELSQEGGEKGKAAMMIIGWDSKEAHEEAKAAPGNVIVENIGLLMGEQTGLDMFHVNFKQL